MRKLFCIVLMLLLLLTACNHGEDSENGLLPDSEAAHSLRLASSRLVQSIDPTYVRSEMEVFLASLAFEGLVKREGEELLPALARDWQISPDGLTYTFYLREDVLFHNGRPMTGDDVKFSWERVLRFKAASAYVFSNIQGYEDVLAERSRELSGVTIDGDYILQVHLKAPQANFLEGLATPAAYVLNRLEIVEQGADFARAGSLAQVYPPPSGTGPLYFAEWLQERHITLGAFADYYGEKSALQRLELSLDLSTQDALIKLMGGNLDMVLDLNQDDLELNLLSAGLKTLSKPVRTFNYLVCSPTAAPFDNPLLRQAVFEIVDALDIVALGLKQSGFDPEQGFVDYWYTLEGVSRSLPAPPDAEVLLAAAGYGAEGQSLPRLVLDCGPNLHEQAIAQAIANALEEAGFGVEIRSHSYSQLRQLIHAGNTGFYVGEFSDKGGGLDSFFSEVCDARWQGVIPAGAWSSFIEGGYQRGGEAKKEQFKQAEASLRQGHVLCFLAYHKQHLAAGGQWTEMDIPPAGGLDWGKIFPE